jgi:hypothetical protein
MNFSDLPSLEPDIEKLKIELKELCEQYNIVRFEPEDIVELLQDGEEVEWIISQLQQDNAELDGEKFTALLSSIGSIVALPKQEQEEEIIPSIESAEDGEFEAEEAQPFDLSQVDLSQMGPELEALTGMKLPAGIDLKQVQKMMQSPQGAMLSDFGLFCQEQGVDMNAMNDPKLMQDLNEQWMASPRPAFDGKTPAEMTANDPSLLSMKKVETFRRAEPRVGRNDPCPCGSGKKYKKCCGTGI